GAHARARPSRGSVPCVRWGCRGSVHGGIFGGRDTLVPSFVTDPPGSWVWFTKTRGTTWFQVRGCRHHQGASSPALRLTRRPGPSRVILRPIRTRGGHRPGAAPSG